MSDCWESKYKPRSNGYVKGTMSGKYGYLHRLMWEAFNGPVPEGMDICHTCDNRKCVNPQHLFVGSRADNMRDAQIKGRIQRGEDRHNAKLTEDDVRLIRASNQPPKELAQMLGVHVTSIRNIINRKSWRHIA